MNKNSQDDEFLISLKDLFQICLRAKRKILITGLVFSLLLGLYALQKPVQYEAEATFREKSNSSAGISTSSIAELFLSGSTSGGNSEAVSMMKSRKILGEVVSNLGMQTTISQPGKSFPRIRRFWENLVIEYTLFRKIPYPALKDKEELITAVNVSYKDEIPLSADLRFTSDNQFEVSDSEGNTLGIGTIGTPLNLPQFSFTLINNTNKPLDSLFFTLRFEPLEKISTALSKQITVKADKNDSSVLCLSYSNRNRHLACKVLNTLMFSFQNYLKEEQDRISSEQISYLRKREGEMSDHLVLMMDKYADKLSEEVSRAGFANSEKAMEFLATQGQNFEKQTMMIDLEIERLSKEKGGKFVFDDTYQTGNQSSTIQILLNEVRHLNQKGDGMEIALRNSTLHSPEELKSAFKKQVVDLEEVVACQKESKELLATLDRDQIPLPTKRLFDDSKYLTKEWHNKLVAASQNNDWNECKDQFTAYLNNLNRFFGVQKKTIEERLAHQQGPQNDFQGINLQTADALYVSYSKNLSDVEAQIAETVFIIDQMKHPEFEISSLSTILTDSVSRDMINRASTLVLAIQDDGNHSEIEKDRLKKELVLQKKFLSLHVTQTLELLELRKNLVKDKLQSLQSTSLELIHQNTSIKEKQLADYIETHIRNLKQEKNLIEQHQKELRVEMAKLPKKWVSESLIKQHLTMNEKMVEEVTKLVESKNISKNLEIVQSSPIDIAIPPIQPNQPKLLLLTILGGFLGVFISLSSLIASSIIRGIPATTESLTLSQMHVSGEILKNDDNLGTYRRVLSYITSSPFENSLLVFQNERCNHGENIAKLLAKSGLKVLLLPISFKTQPSKEELPGLLQYLEENSAEPKIIHHKEFDTIAEGGFTPYGNELISSKKFQKLLSKLNDEYDYVIAVTETTPSAPEAEGTLHSFSHAIVTVSDETLQELKPLMDLSAEKRITFIIESNS